MNRISRMGSLAAGVAGTMAVNGLIRLGKGDRPTARDLLLTPGNIRRIADELAKMRGAAMKVGQLISMDAGEFLPPELAEIMSRLRAEADFMPPKQLKQVLNAELGDGWLSRFAQFDVRPIAAASIGQVHKARLKDGREVAIKVQYPGIARSIDSDVSNVGRLIKLSGLMPPGLEMEPFLEEAKAQLHEEADYVKEAEHLERFHALLSDDTRFVLPAYLPELSSPRVLAMDYIESTGIEAVETAPQDVRDRVAHELMELTLKELFRFNWMQTDPNFANYRFQSESGRLVLLDFGATRAVPETIVEAYRTLFQAGLKGSDAEVLEAPALRLGLLSPGIEDRHRDTILAMLRLVFEDITRTDLFDFAASDMLARLNRMGEEMAAERVILPPPPMDVLYVQRKFAGMFLLATRLKARVALGDLLAKAVA
jgi:predicted unusual protein kinase regulating ubiquinone biosynthesis (AarF/ABC1/UbiB family)